MITTQFLTGLSNQLAKSWLINLLTPLFLFWAGGLVVTLPKLGGWQNTYEALNEFSQPQQIGFLIFSILFVLISAFLIEQWNFATLQFLEGYWPFWLRNCFVELEKARKKKAEKQFQVLHKKMKNPGLTPQEKEKLVRVEEKLNNMPFKEEDIMATRLGNILRRAELLPFVKYGLDTVLCWPHLWLLLPEQVRQDLGEARNQLDTAVRFWCWSLLFTVSSLWSIWALPIGLLSALFAYYHWIINAARIYRDLLEATFDLYRFHLYSSLKFPLPATQEGEKILATQLNTFLQRGYYPPNFHYTLPDSW